MLKLESEPDNKYDKNAIKILNKNGEHIGYMPRYYSESITKLLNEDYNYKCIVLEVNKDKRMS